MKPETKITGQKFTPIWFGILGSLAVFLFILWLAVQPAPENAGTRAAEFWSLPLNSMGDALAGLAASLAFLWLIVTAFIQKNELKEQRAELELAREVQEEQLNAMRAQARVFQDEQKQRAEDRAEQELDAELANLVRRVLEIDGMDELVEYAFMLDSCIDHRFGVERYRTDPPPPFYRDIEGDAEFVYELYLNLEYRFQTVVTWQRSINPSSIDLAFMKEIRGCVASALALEPHLSRAQRTRLNTMRLQRIGQIIDELLAYFDEFWIGDSNGGNRKLEAPQ